MSKSNKLVFFGNERLATAASTTAPTLRSLVAAGYEVEAVIANHEDPISRKKRDLEIGLVAQSFGIPVILSGKDIPLVAKLEKHRADAAVLVAFGKIIHQEVVDLFPKGIINIHPSLLPKYRGPTPIEQTILDGARETGVSIMQLSSKMDAGPIYAQAKISLSGKESKAELAEKLLNLGAELLLKNLPAILDGLLEPTPQDESKVSYTKLLKKEDGAIKRDQPAEIIERQIRAYLGFPKSRAEIFNNTVIITKARIAQSQDDGSLVMQCQPGWLEIQELIAPSGRTMSGAEFLRGYQR